MDLQKIFQLKSRFVAREVGNEMILVPLTGNVAQMNALFTLNETGKFIWENIQEKSSVKDIELLMTEAFDIDSETAGKDIEIFLKRLETAFL